MADERTDWLSRPILHRNRFACVGNPVSRAETERQGLREAVYELLSGDPLSRDRVTAGILDHWGSATEQQIGRALTVLQRDGAIRRVRGGYVRREP